MRNLKQLPNASVDEINTYWKLSGGDDGFINDFEFRYSSLKRDFEYALWTSKTGGTFIFGLGYLKWENDGNWVIYGYKYGSIGLKRTAIWESGTKWTK